MENNNTTTNTTNTTNVSADNKYQPIITLEEEVFTFPKCIL